MTARLGRCAMPDCDPEPLRRLIETFCCLPGVGVKTARRMAYQLLEKDRAGGRALAAALAQAMERIRHCAACRNFTEAEQCAVCADPGRDGAQLCVVESPSEVRLLEEHTGYRGRYFVLMGRISPLDGIGPEEIGLPQLEAQLEDGAVREMILAINATLESDVTAHMLQTLAARHRVRVTRLARGVPMGGELEYLDAGTLLSAFEGRTALE